MQKLFLLLTLAAGIGCQSKTGETTADNSQTTTNGSQIAETGSSVIEGCYMGVLKRDTFAANLKQQGNKISGRLVFDNYEKDGSTGTVTGILEADILKLSYRFSSEGMNSVSEVYFKYNDGELIQGVGEIGVIEDSTFFIGPAPVVYEGTVLKKIPCEYFPINKEY